MSELASDADPVFVGSRSLAPSQQGLLVLGVPVGSGPFVAAQLRALADSHGVLLTRLLGLEDVQASWLLLVFCCSPRSNHVLCLLPPDSTVDFALAHDVAMGDCLSALGGLGLRSAVAVAPAAYWASWADSLPVLQRQARELLQQVLSGFASLAASVPCLRSAAAAFPALPDETDGLFVTGNPARGWQRQATAAVEDQAFQACPPACWSPSKALLPVGSLRPPRRSPNLPPLHTCSGRSCSVASVSHSLSLRTHVDAIAVWTLLATVVQRVQRPGFCGAVVAALSEPLLGSAVKLGHG